MAHQVFLIEPAFKNISLSLLKFCVFHLQVLWKRLQKNYSKTDTYYIRVKQLAPIMMQDYCKDLHAISKFTYLDLQFQIQKLKISL